MGKIAASVASTFSWSALASCNMGFAPSSRNSVLPDFVVQRLTRETQELRGFGAPVAVPLQTIQYPFALRQKRLLIADSPAGCQQRSNIPVGNDAAPLRSCCLQHGAQFCNVAGPVVSKEDAISRWSKSRLLASGEAAQNGFGKHWQIFQMLPKRGDFDADSTQPLQKFLIESSGVRLGSKIEAAYPDEPDA